MRIATILFILAFCIQSCENKAPDNQEETSKNETMTINDPHSYANADEIAVKHIHLNLTPDFENKTIGGSAELTIERLKQTDKAVLDTRGLEVDGVTDEAGNELKFELGREDEHLGTPLTVSLLPETKKVIINYNTSDHAEALQWMNPQQTAGKQHPFLFTQSQAILARTWVPCQDGPGYRFTYSADVTVPKDLLPLMSASNPTEKNETGTYHFEMKQPIPSYLLALAVGDLEFESLSERTGVYAEPSLLGKSAYEFGEMDDMLVAAEELYGPYRWDRYDVIVLPPSFPFGGMENPRLTFATPTILAGDRSLVSLIAHELAHSWSGNLVTNATWDDFWLNEGFTVYFERRIMEAIEDASYADMLEQLGYADLRRTIESDLATTPEDQHLKLSLEGRNPDDGVTEVAYEKGYLFLRTVEEAVGREKFDAFLKEYFETNAFKVMTTEEFITYLDKNLLHGDEELKAKINYMEWIYEPGIPNTVPAISSDRFRNVEAEMMAFVNESKKTNELDTADWTTHEWIHFLRQLPEEATVEHMNKLDNAFAFSQSTNSEIFFEWTRHSVPVGHEATIKSLSETLMTVGRRKFLVPAYRALVKYDPSKKIANEVYAKARPNYHAVSTRTLDEILGYQSN